MKLHQKTIKSLLYKINTLDRYGQDIEEYEFDSPNESLTPNAYGEYVLFDDVLLLLEECLEKEDK
jgi:hypothetical protein